METNNTYVKYCANVFLAKCTKPYNKGDCIEIETKYGKINEHIIYNLILEKDGFYYYSIVRADGFNAQERARLKAEKYQTYASNAESRSNAWYKKSREGAEFLKLAEPIKVGHHSEARHRALIERNNSRMSNSYNESKKADSYDSKIAYWESKVNDINLSMPESIEYYTYKLEKAKEYHTGLKNGTIPRNRMHSYELTYAKKDVNEAQKNLDLAIKLWA